MRSSSRERMLCTICQARIPIKPFCPECGNPTAYASREERIQYELEKWGARPAEQPDRVIDLAAIERAALEKQAKPPVEPKKRRRRPDQPVVRHVEPWPVPAVTAGTNGNNGRSPETRAPERGKPEKWRRAVSLLPDELVAFVKEGKCGPERATLVITRYRAIVVSGNKARWVPLENIDRVELLDGRSKRLLIGGSIEYLAFRHPDRKLLEAIRDVLEHEARLGNMPGGLRHHPDVMQEWAERVSDIWKAPYRPVRLWAHRHPAALAVLR